jgi:hypothetical protein
MIKNMINEYIYIDQYDQPISTRKDLEMRDVVIIHDLFFLGDTSHQVCSPTGLSKLIKG